MAEPQVARRENCIVMSISTKLMLRDIYELVLESNRSDALQVSWVLSKKVAGHVFQYVQCSVPLYIGGSVFMQLFEFNPIVSISTPSLDEGLPSSGAK